MGQIEFRSETGVSADGATVEVGTVTFNGRDFAALGSVVDTARGIVFGYVSEREGCFILTTWEGAEIAPLRLVRRFKSYGVTRCELWAWSAIVGGRVYSGRNSGAGMLVRMRGGKVAS